MKQTQRHMSAHKRALISRLESQHGQSATQQLHPGANQSAAESPAAPQFIRRQPMLGELHLRHK